jgi:hypothetical protein
MRSSLSGGSDKHAGEAARTIDPLGRIRPVR